MFLLEKCSSEIDSVFLMIFVFDSKKLKENEN